MKISNSSFITPAVSRMEKMKESGWNNIHSQSQTFYEKNSQQYSNGMTNLHGLVVHGASCASLLALGSMAAVGLESSYEILNEKAYSASQYTGFVGQWPTEVTIMAPIKRSNAESFRDENVVLPTVLITEFPEVDYSSQAEIDDALNTVTEFQQGTRSIEIYTDSVPYYGRKMSDNSIDYNGEFIFKVENAAGQAVMDPFSLDEQPVFSGRSQPDSVIELLHQDGSLLATASADANGYWRMTLPNTIAAGQYELSMFLTDVKGGRALVAEKIRLDIVILRDSIETQGSPSYTLMPLYEQDNFINLLPNIEQAPEIFIAENPGLSLGELLIINTFEIFPQINEFAPLAQPHESALQELIHPEGSVLFWHESEPQALNYRGGEINIKLDLLNGDPLNVDL